MFAVGQPQQEFDRSIPAFAYGRDLRTDHPGPPGQQLAGFAREVGHGLEIRRVFTPYPLPDLERPKAGLPQFPGDEGLQFGKGQIAQINAHSSPLAALR